MKYDLLRAVDNGANIQDMDLRVVDYARVSTAAASSARVLRISWTPTVR